MGMRRKHSLLQEPEWEVLLSYFELVSFLIGWLWHTEVVSVKKDSYVEADFEIWSMSMLLLAKFQILVIKKCVLVCLILTYRLVQIWTLMYWCRNKKSKIYWSHYLIKKLIRQMDDKANGINYSCCLVLYGGCTMSSVTRIVCCCLSGSLQS